MQKIVVTSENPAKVESVKEWFKKLFPDLLFEFVSISVASDVSEQPIWDDETFNWAMNRINNATKEISADYYVGIESWIEKSIHWIWVVDRVLVRSKTWKVWKAKSWVFYLPEKVNELINSWKTLWEASKIIFNKIKTDKKSWTIWVLTNNIVTRTNKYLNTIALALIPFKNPKLY